MGTVGSGDVEDPILGLGRGSRGELLGELSCVLVPLLELVGQLEKPEVETADAELVGLGSSIEVPEIGVSRYESPGLGWVGASCTCTIGGSVWYCSFLSSRQMARTPSRSVA